MENKLPTLDPIVNLAKRRGIFYNTAELYGGANGLFDRGPLGVEMVMRIKQLWWKRFVHRRDDVVGLDAAIITPAVVLQASGHTENFTDPLIECLNCHIRLRADHFLEEESDEVFSIRWRDEAMRIRKIGEKRAEEEAHSARMKLNDEQVLTCPSCGESHFTESRSFNMMFKTQLGAVEGAGAEAYLRPETAQGIFTNYKNILDSYHKKLPFGVAQIGKAFRNEITTGNSIFRIRELEQAEIEYFVKPGEDEAFFEHWKGEWYAFLTEDIGLKPEMLREYEHPKEKLSHYSKRTMDYEYAFPFGWGELTGLANRTDFDLRQHMEASSRDLTYFEEESRERFLPFTIEPTLGIDRTLLAVLCDAYREYPKGRDGNGTEMETVLHLPKQLAPVQVAVLPLMKKDGLGDKAREVAGMLRQHTVTVYDETGAIGKRYRRQDEIGTPACVTVDYQTLEDGTVTVRDRDTMEQRRVKIEELPSLCK
ncbi:MAG: glycine--tRNA ligase [Candidatus Paceibacterota bacterium]